MSGVGMLLGSFTVVLILQTIVLVGLSVLSLRMSRALTTFLNIWTNQMNVTAALMLLTKSFKGADLAEAEAHEPPRPPEAGSNGHHA